MIDQFQCAVFIDTGEQRKLRERGAAMDQRSAGIVADAADDRCTETGRADDRVWLTAERLECSLQFIQRGAWKGEDLTAIFEQMHALEPGHADDGHFPVVVGSEWRGASGEPRIRCLRNHDAAATHASSTFHNSTREPGMTTAEARPSP
jgi:hypothetical protein